jgi:hypothetical protein
MAELIWNDAFFSIDDSAGTPVDLSDHVRSLTLNYGAELLEITAMGDGARDRIAGYRDWSVEVEFNQDFAAANVDDTMFDLVGHANTQSIAIRPTSAAVGATNPEYQGEVRVESYPPVGGGVGEVLTTSVTLQGSDTLTRAVA